jgi:hypothetical protein
MARETITDLLYQYIRAVVHSGFRDGLVSGVRDAMGLDAAAEEIDHGQVQGEENPSRAGERAGNISQSPRPLPGVSLRQLPNHPPQQDGRCTDGEKRGRGRPRKYPPPRPAGEKSPGEKTPPEKSNGGGPTS